MLFKLLTNLFFPPVCVGCRKRIASGMVCEACFSGIAVCDSLEPADPDRPYVLGTAAEYENPALKSLVHHLKFRFAKSAAEPLARLLIDYAGRANLDLAGFFVIPIPLSRKRLRSRGYNQSELIARAFAASLKLPVLVGPLVRARHAKPQSETKSAAERKENVRGAFMVQEVAAIRGKNILLIDDVSTSGSTFLEASLALKAAGAARIIALAAAKPRLQ